VQSGTPGFDSCHNRRQSAAGGLVTPVIASLLMSFLTPLSMFSTSVPEVRWDGCGLPNQRTLFGCVVDRDSLNVLLGSIPAVEIPESRADNIRHSSARAGTTGCGLMPHHGPIRRREVTRVQRSGVELCEDALKALDFGNGLLGIHPSQYPT
jgi:hypothetical protein